MSKGAIAKKNTAMAADLLKRGIWHGKRVTSPKHDNYPSLTEVGSAAYRRRNKK